jgi:hypothetical protein
MGRERWWASDTDRRAEAVTIHGLPDCQARLSVRRVKTSQLNRRIAKLSGRQPAYYGVFATAAALAGRAIAAAEELNDAPTIDKGELAPVLEFWHRVRDFNGAGALALMGGNQTLAEALVTLQLLTPERK